MDFGSFLTAPEINVKVITYRDIFQDKAMLENRFGDEYKDLSAIIKLDHADFKQLDVKKRRHSNFKKIPLEELW
ncbi:hypothetical protein [Methanosarcina barkeri]|uniref:hypothetical protein n=1 Tax=Methanosarcina barkeri TaxID=2208 RepID=UPI000AE73E3F|nr:hypothetical protein [Methanosarcina barkeri]